MKKIILFIYLIVSVVTLNAQSSAVKKAYKSIVKLTTYKADGSVLASGYGAFISNDGTTLTAWTPFEGAYSAKVTDATGKVYDVECLYGASQIYNVAKLKVKLPEKSSISSLLIEQGQQSVGNEAWCMGYDVKSPIYHKLSIAKVETFMDNLPYYVVEQSSAAIGDDMIGMPILNAQGQMMGLMYTSTTRTDLYVASARYAQGLEPNALSANDNALRKTNVRIALPLDYNQAMVALLVAGQKDTPEAYSASIDEFISLFPDKEDGYLTKAQWQYENKDFAGADASIATAFGKTDDKANVHYVYSRIIYEKETTMTDVPYEAWSLDKSVAEIDEAITANPLPAYKMHKGKVLYAQQKYDEAYNIFDGINKEGMCDAEVYYFAYQCLKKMDAEKSEQLAQLDSAVVISPNTLLYQAEKTLLLLKMGNAQDAEEVGQNMTKIAPFYAEGHGLYGLALCMNGKKVEGIEELKRAKSMGYNQAEGFLKKYGN